MFGEKFTIGSNHENNTDGKNIEHKEKKTGANTRILLTFGRHAQKQESATFSTDGSQISQSLISEYGKEQAQQFGSERENIFYTKGYHTESARTEETLDNVVAGLQQDDIQKGTYFSFPAIDLSTETIDVYKNIMHVAKSEYMHKHFPDKSWDELSLDQQEKAMEEIEEPALQNYLNNDQNRPDPETLSPYEVASLMAYKVNRLINVVQYMPEDKEVNLLSIGHKTSTEAFLKYVLVMEDENGNEVTGFKNLSEIGGSLETMEMWDLDISTDAQGDRFVHIVLRDQVYAVDVSAVQALAENGRNLLGLEQQKIDNNI